MVLRCPSCGKPVPSDAPACPSCLLPRKAFGLLARSRKVDLNAPPIEEGPPAPPLISPTQTPLPQAPPRPSTPAPSPPPTARAAPPQPEKKAASPEAVMKGTDFHVLRKDSMPIPQTKSPSRPRRKTRVFKEVSDKAALPAILPPEVAKAVSGAAHTPALGELFPWTLKRAAEGGDIYELLDVYFKRFVERVLQQRAELSATHESALAAAVLLRSLRALTPHRVKYAEQGINPQFVETWLQKQLVATLVDAGIDDVDVAMQLSGKRTPEYLEDKLEVLIPQTFLENLNL